VSDLRERAGAIEWYHTIELAPGVASAGLFDLRGLVDRYGLPERMEGMRALDVGTWDGFWAFEMERRGAEVVALDLDDESQLDWPPRRRAPNPDRLGSGGFRLAREALGSRVERVVGNVYDARPEELGTFDLVFCGSVLVHVRDQLLALERLAALSRRRLVLAEPYHRGLGLLPMAVSRYRADRDGAVVFWEPNARAWRRMIWSAGFDEVRLHSRFWMRSSRGYRVRHAVYHAAKVPAA
jgi:tRNA (mo5U34)-methyltransferase